jgi:hypothetical protein
MNVAGQRLMLASPRAGINHSCFHRCDAHSPSVLGLSRHLAGIVATAAWLPQSEQSGKNRYFRIGREAIFRTCSERPGHLAWQLSAANTVFIPHGGI